MDLYNAQLRYARAHAGAFSVDIKRLAAYSTRPQSFDGDCRAESSAVHVAVPGGKEDGGWNACVVGPSGSLFVNGNRLLRPVASC